MELRGTVNLFAYDYGFGRVREGINKDVGVGCNEELGAGGGFDQSLATSGMMSGWRPSSGSSMQMTGGGSGWQSTVNRQR